MRFWHKAVLPGLVTLVLLLAGCRATAQVSVQAQPNGSGTVTVTVTLDKAATEAVGGVAGQLQTGDLAAAGWAVTGPVTAADGATVISARKGFATLSQASQIVQEIAGSGTPASRPFQLTLQRHASFWKTTTTLSGHVDLTCGLACFGDPGLAKALGSSTGISPASVPGAAGDFAFGLGVSLPGSLASTNGTGRQATDLRWTPKLGEDLPLAAVTTTTNEAHVHEVIGAGAAVVVLVAGIVVWRVVRRWRRRRRPAHAKSS